MKNRQLKGTPVTIHKSLCEDILVAGVPNKLFIFNWGLCLMIGIASRAYYLIPAFIFTHYILKKVHEKDSLFYKLLLRYFSHPRYYST